MPTAEKGEPPAPTPPSGPPSFQLILRPPAPPGLGDPGFEPAGVGDPLLDASTSSMVDVPPFASFFSVKVRAAVRRIAEGFPWPWRISAISSVVMFSRASSMLRLVLEDRPLTPLTPLTSELRGWIPHQSPPTNKQYLACIPYASPPLCGGVRRAGRLVDAGEPTSVRPHPAPRAPPHHR